MREDIYQGVITDWLQKFEDAYPDVMTFYHVANERRCGKIEGAKLKRMGVRRGVADLVILLDRGKSLYVEVKGDGGSQKPEQVAWQLKIERLGHTYILFHPKDLWEAKEGIRKIVLNALPPKISEWIPEEL